MTRRKLSERLHRNSKGRLTRRRRGVARNGHRHKHRVTRASHRHRFTLTKRVNRKYPFQREFPRPRTRGRLLHWVYNEILQQAFCCPCKYYHPHTQDIGKDAHPPLPLRPESRNAVAVAVAVAGAVSPKDPSSRVVLTSFPSSRRKREASFRVDRRSTYGILQVRGFFGIVFQSLETLAVVHE